MRHIGMWFVLWACTPGAQIARADTPITLSNQKVESKFRRSLVFSVRARSTAGNRVKVCVINDAHKGDPFKLSPNFVSGSRCCVGETR